MGNRILAGIVGAVIAGILFGMAMHMMGTIDVIADMVGAESAAVGWGIHLMMSAIFGLVYGLVLMAISSRIPANLGLGAAYGIAIWIVGPMIIQPMMTGEAVAAIDVDAIMALMGHIVWGLLTGAIAAGLYARLATRSSTASRQSV